MNLFPVTATIDGQTFKTCRMVYDGTNTVVWWWDAKTHLPTVVAEAPGKIEPVGVIWTVGPAQVVKQGGCGCGHPLRRWNPGKPARAHT